MSILDDPDTLPNMYEPILWHDEYERLPDARLVDLAKRLLAKPMGDEVVLDALSMRLHGKKCEMDTLGSELRLIGLNAAIQRLRRDTNDQGGSMDYKMESVVGAALRFEGNEDEKLEWLKTIFASIDEGHGYIYTFDTTITTSVSSMPEEFLNRIFEGSEKQKSSSLFFLQHCSFRQPLLAKTDTDTLISWCCTRNDRSVWACVAAGVDLWTTTGNPGNETVAMSVSAIKLLEASPDPKTVLEKFAERVAPSSWSGSRVNVMQPRANAIGALAEHESEVIALAAKLITVKLRDCIEREKANEKLEDEKYEQHFE